MKLPQVTEINGIRVLTTQQVSDMYGTNRQTISYNFNYNKSKFKEGKHYIVLSGQALRDFKGCHENLDNLKYAHIAYLWTEKGALFHAKSVNTEKAWEAYEYLVDFYFRAKEQPQITQTKPEPVKKPSGREVVDIPENAEIQAAIQEVHKQLVAMDSVLKAFNRYQCKENYLHLESTLELLWHETGRKIINLMDIEPNLVVKSGY